MRTHLDWSKSIRNPYAKLLKKPVTLSLDFVTNAYFRKLAGETGLPLQDVIKMYLKECVHRQRRLQLRWSSRRARPQKV